MSKQVKQLICEEISRRFAEVDACVVIDPTGLDGITANRLRAEMARSGVHMQMVKNSLARRALAGQPLAAVGDLLEGSCALAWGGDSIVDVAKLLTGKLKELPNLVIKGAVLDGQPLGPDQAVDLSKWLSKAEQRSMLVGQVLSPGRNLAAAILGPGAAIAGLLKGRIEQLEKSEPAPAAV